MKEMLRLLLPPIFLKLRYIPPFLKGKTLYRNIILRDELAKQITEISEIEELFPEDKIKNHYVFEPIRDTLTNPDLYITQLRYYWYYCYFKNNNPDIFKKNITVLDVGASSGIFLESISKKGTALNLSKKCINFMDKRGIAAIQDNAEYIDLPDNSFDYVVSFQCLEHLPNPIKVLNEFGRLAKKKVFISIPYTEKTKIYDLNYGIKLKKESWKVKGDIACGSGHIFEFSTEDFKKILTFTNLEYKYNFPLLYFENNTPYRRWYNQYHKSYFNFFILSPKNN